MTEMYIETDEDILNKAAYDGSMEYSSWPALLPALLSRINKAAHNDFPIPRIPPPRPLVRPPSPRFLAPLPSSDPVEAPDSSGTTPSSQETNKENANPSPPSSRNAAPAVVPSSSTAVSSAPDPTPQPEPLEPGALPPPVAALLNEITSTLTLNFSDYPPHTIQRLSELVLRPRQHYRHLVAYLHALDRIVHVTSGANIYPLPPAVPDMGAMNLLANGVGGSGAGGLSINSTLANNIGSDEALGGALLTPIPWLARRTNGRESEDISDLGSSSPLSEGSGHSQQQVQIQSQPSQQQPQSQPQVQQQIGSNSRSKEPQLRTESTETIDGPNGMGSIETVSISIGGIPSTGAGTVLANRGVTQGELLRQEQRAGVVPLSQLARQQQQQGQSTSPTVAAPEDEDSAMTEGNPEDEVPHARGPEEIGPADMGPQSATTSPYTVGPGGGVDIQGIDVEAAVGRRHSPTEQGQTQEPPVPRSPKREAAEELESPPAKKRVAEDGEGNPESVGATNERASQEKQDDEPRRDAEGDVVIGDTDHPTDVSFAPVVQSEAEGKAEGSETDGDKTMEDADGLKEKGEEPKAAEGVSAPTAGDTSEETGESKSEGDSGGGVPPSA